MHRKDRNRIPLNFVLLPRNNFWVVGEPMKYILYLEASRLAELESHPAIETKGSPKTVPGWLLWLWQHRHGGARDCAQLARPDAPLQNPALPVVALLETNHRYERLSDALKEGHTLVLEWQGKGTAKTMRIRTKTLDKTWVETSDQADLLKSIRSALRQCSQASKAIKRQQRVQASKLSEEQIVQQFCRCIDEHYADNRINIPHLARLCGVSNVRLQQVCQQHLGQGPKAYLVQQRINKATDLIRNWPENRRCILSKIAEKAGFSSPSYFSALFMAYTGQTPTEFRHQHLQNKEL
ncbi:MAG: hypothetical protein RLZZ121_469 [Bacteroidota bacterium]